VISGLLTTADARWSVNDCLRSRWLDGICCERLAKHAIPNTFLLPKDSFQVMREYDFDNSLRARRGAVLQPHEAVHFSHWRWSPGSNEPLTYVSPAFNRDADHLDGLEEGEWELAPPPARSLRLESSTVSEAQAAALFEHHHNSSTQAFVRPPTTRAHGTFPLSRITSSMLSSSSSATTASSSSTAAAASTCSPPLSSSSSSCSLSSLPFSLSPSSSSCTPSSSPSGNLPATNSSPSSYSASRSSSPSSSYSSPSPTLGSAPLASSDTNSKQPGSAPLSSTSAFRLRQVSGRSSLLLDRRKRLQINGRLSRQIASTPDVRM
jgi:hypothetical protein